MKTLKHLLYVILITVLLVSCAPAAEAPEETAPPEAIEAPEETTPPGGAPEGFAVVVRGKSVHPYGYPWANGGNGLEAYDCWGLLRAYYRQVCGCDLPPVNVDATRAVAVAHAFAGHAELWQLAAG